MWPLGAWLLWGARGVRRCTVQIPRVGAGAERWGSRGGLTTHCPGMVRSTPPCPHTLHLRMRALLPKSAAYDGKQQETTGRPQVWGLSMLESPTLCVCVCFGTLPSVWALSSQTRDITRAKAVKASSPNHRPAREFLQRTCFDVQQVGRPGAGFCGGPLERCQLSCACAGN